MKQQDVVSSAFDMSISDAVMQTLVGTCDAFSFAFSSGLTAYKYYVFDMEAIKAKYKDQGLEMHHNRGHKKGQASKKGKKGKKGKKNGKDKGKGAMKAHFLLLDPAVPVQETPGED